MIFHDSILSHPRRLMIKKANPTPMANPAPDSPTMATPLTPGENFERLIAPMMNSIPTMGTIRLPERLTIVSFLQS